MFISFVLTSPLFKVSIEKRAKSNYCQNCWYSKYNPSKARCSGRSIDKL